MLEACDFLNLFKFHVPHVISDCNLTSSISPQKDVQLVDMQYLVSLAGVMHLLIGELR